MPRPVSRADLARLFSISRAAVTKRCQKDWADACNGDRVDLDHPAIKAAAKKKGVKLFAPDRAPTKPAKAAPAAPAEPTAEPEIVLPRASKPTKHRPESEPLPEQPDGAWSDEDLVELQRQLRPLLDRFGTFRGFRDCLAALKTMEDIQGRRMANLEARRLVIPREFVKTHIFGAIEGLNRRLLADTPKTLCREVYALARSGVALEEAEQRVRKLLSKQLEGVKKHAVDAIQNAGGNGTDVGRSGVAGGAIRWPHDRNDPDDTVGVGRS